MRATPGNVVWATSVAALLAGLFALAIGYVGEAVLLMSLSVGAFALRTVRDASWPLLFPGLAALVLAAVTVLGLLDFRLVPVTALILLGTQFAIASLAPPTRLPARRRRVAGFAHGLAAGAIAAYVLVGPKPAIALAATAALTALAILASWRDAQARSWVWEAGLLFSAAAITLAEGGLAAMAEFAPPWFTAIGPFLSLPLLAFLAPPVVEAPAPRTNVLQAGARALAGMALLNAMFLLLATVAAATAGAALLIVATFAATAALLEYSAARHIARMRNAASTPLRPLAEPITIVIAARDEAKNLRESLEENLRLDPKVRFLIVPAASSTDETVEVAKMAARAHPERVRVVVGSSGTKAGDLNAAWETLDTKLALLLDADETTDDASVARAVQTMRELRGVGIVQGRKVSRTPESGALSRFVTTERRHSTSLDQPLYADEFSAGHFAGSAALVRVELPPSIGGWSENALTEDIDLTMRVHLETKWRIAYDARVVAREADPGDLRSLIEQRTRWARGWMQCVGRYFPRVIQQRRELGAKRTFALSWLLFSAVSAPFFTLFPALLALRLAGDGFVFPLAVALLVGVLVMPARLVTYTYAGIVDPVAPVPRKAGRLVELALHAYLWIPLSWIIQFHAAHLEISRAPRTWTVTEKRAPERTRRWRRVTSRTAGAP